jgi:hypothetical protein
MKHALLGACALAFAFSVSGCNSASTDVALANNALATLAKYDIPTACSIIAVAEGYFSQLESNLSAVEIADETKAANAVNIICNAPQQMLRQRSERWCRRGSQSRMIRQYQRQLPPRLLQQQRPTEPTTSERKLS